MTKKYNRRQLLTAGATATTLGLAGCTDSSSTEEEPKANITLEESEITEEWIKEQYVGEDLYEQNLTDTEAYNILENSENITTDIQQELTGGEENIKSEYLDGDQIDQQKVEQLIQEYRTEDQPLFEDLEQINEFYSQEKIEEELDEELDTEYNQTTAQNHTGLNTTELTETENSTEYNQTTSETSTTPETSIDITRAFNLYATVHQIDQETETEHTETFIQDLETQLPLLNTAYEIGETYQTKAQTPEEEEEELEKEPEIFDPERIIKATLTEKEESENITDTELSYLNKTKVEELPENPLNSNWAGDSIGNKLYLDLNIDPQEGDELLADLNEETYQDIQIESGNIVFEKESSITGETFTTTLETEEWNELYENEFKDIREEYGKEEQSDWERSEFVDSRNEALRRIADFTIKHQNQDQETIKEITEEGLQDSERRSTTWSPRLIEKLSGVNQFTDLYLENELTEESLKFYELTKDGDLGEEAIMNIKEELEEEKEIPTTRTDEPEEPEDLVQTHTPRTTSSSSSSSSSGGGDSGGGDSGGNSRGGGPGGN